MGSPTSRCSKNLSINLDLNEYGDDEETMHENVCSSERPIGKKKEKMKRKMDDEMKKLIESLVEDSKELKEYLKIIKGRKKKSRKSMVNSKCYKLKMRQQN